MQGKAKRDRKKEMAKQDKQEEKKVGATEWKELRANKKPYTHIYRRQSQKGTENRLISPCKVTEHRRVFRSSI